MQLNEQLFRLPPVALRAYAEVVREMAQTARTEEVVPSLLELADRFDTLADRQETRKMA
jgi:hypothetical protein